MAAVRNFGGRFLQANDKRGGLHYDIGDKRSWDKTSQALREGQTEIRAKLAEEAEKQPNGADKVREYKQVISEQNFFNFAMKMLHSLYEPDSGSTACGPNCAHARRRQTLSRGDAAALQRAMQLQFPPPPDAVAQTYHNVHYNNTMPPLPDANQHSYDPNYNDVSPIPVHPVHPSFGASNVMAPQPPYCSPAMNSHAAVQLTGGNMNSLQAPPYGAPAQPANCDQSPATETGASSEVSQASGSATSSRGNSSSFEPLDYNKPSALERDLSLNTNDLRNLLCDVGVDMDSDEIAQQLQGLIRRKSHGLIRIDAVDAFEDLVFEEDSIENYDFPESLVENNCNARLTGLSDRGESLMNMSLLTIDDKDGEPVLASGADSEGERIRPNRPSKVSFANENVSLMSMDMASFSDLVQDDPDPDATGERTREKEEDGSPVSARKMGFPVRKTIVKKYAAGLETAIGQISTDGPKEKVSSLTITEYSIGHKENPESFTELAGQVTNPLQSDFSLKVDNMSFSNMSLMSIGSERGLELDEAAEAVAEK